MGLLSLYDQLMPLEYYPDTPQASGSFNGEPDYKFGTRWQEEGDTSPKRAKGLGFYGLLSRPEGDGFSTELGVSNEFGEHPSMAPGLNHYQLKDLLTNNGGSFMPSVYSNADSFQAWRRLQGKDSWRTSRDRQEMLPLAIPEMSLLTYGTK